MRNFTGLTKSRSDFDCVLLLVATRVFDRAHLPACVCMCVFVCMFRAFTFHLFQLLHHFQVYICFKYSLNTEERERWMNGSMASLKKVEQEDEKV